MKSALTPGMLVALLIVTSGGAPPADAQFEAKVNLYAPFSKTLKAGKGGILVNAGSCPDDARAVPGSGSEGLEITQTGFHYSLKRTPAEYNLSITERGFAPAHYSVPRGTEPRMVTFTITNRSTREHRFGGTFFTPRTVMIISGQDFTIPPPTSKAAYIIITEGSTFNIGGEVGYSGSYVGIKPGQTVDVTLDLDQYVRIPELMELAPDKKLQVRCDLPGHQDSFVISLAGTDAEAEQPTRDPARSGPAAHAPLPATPSPDASARFRPLYTTLERAWGRRDSKAVLALRAPDYTQMSVDGTPTDRRKAEKSVRTNLGNPGSRWSVKYQVLGAKVLPEGDAAEVWVRTRWHATLPENMRFDAEEGWVINHRGRGFSADRRSTELHTWQKTTQGWKLLSAATKKVHY